MSHDLAPRLVQGAHRIEAAKSGRSICTTCNNPVNHGDVRVAEQVNDISIGRLIYRFYHLECAIAVHPDLVQRALGNVEPDLRLDVATIEAKIGPRLELDRDQRLARYEAQLAREPARPTAPAPDDTTLQLLAQLAGDPDDAATLAVLADQLQARGDPRGELIAMQLAMAAGRALELGAAPSPKGWVSRGELAHRRAELMHALAPPIDGGDRLVWGTGFVRRLELAGKTGARLADTIALWRHPSLGLLSELELELQGAQDVGFLARLPELLPASLRELELYADQAALGDLGPILAAVPRLRLLGLCGRITFETLAHSGVRRLELALATPFASFAALRPAAVPAVTELAFRAQHPTRNCDELCEVLANNGWLERIATLSLGNSKPRNVLYRGELSAAGIAALERGLAGRRLAKLDLTGTPVRLALRTRLAALCDALVMPHVENEPSTAAELWVEHANKPEWGRGRIVERRGGKVTIDFETAGRKVFKDDAPFLRYG
jgi:uncharacterized protein (TIGR02996 family)